MGEGAGLHIPEAYARRYGAQEFSKDCHVVNDTFGPWLVGAVASARDALTEQFLRHRVTAARIWSDSYSHGSVCRRKRSFFWLLHLALVEGGFQQMRGTHVRLVGYGMMARRFLVGLDGMGALRDFRSESCRENCEVGQL